MTTHYLIIEDTKQRLDWLRAILPGAAVIGPSIRDLARPCGTDLEKEMIRIDAEIIKPLVDSLVGGDELWVWFDAKLNGREYNNADDNVKRFKTKFEYALGTPHIHKKDAFLGWLVLGYLTERVLAVDNDRPFDVVLISASTEQNTPDSVREVVPICKKNKRLIRRFLIAPDLDIHTSTIGGVLDVNDDTSYRAEMAELRRLFFPTAGAFTPAHEPPSTRMKQLQEERRNGFVQGGSEFIKFHIDTKDKLAEFPEHHRLSTACWKLADCHGAVFDSVKFLSCFSDGESRLGRERYWPALADRWMRWVFGPAFPDMTPEGFFPLTSPFLPFLDLLAHTWDALDTGHNAPTSISFRVDEKYSYAEITVPKFIGLETIKTNALRFKEDVRERWSPKGAAQHFAAITQLHRMSKYRPFWYFPNATFDVKQSSSGGVMQLRWHAELSSMLKSD